MNSSDFSTARHTIYSRKSYIGYILHGTRAYVGLSINKSNKKISLRKASGTKARDIILMALYRAGKNGISQKDLADKANVASDTVYEVCKKLEEQGIVRIQHNGRRTRYYATSRIFDELFLYSLIFGDDIFSKIEDPFLYVTTQRQLTVGRDDRFYGNSTYYETKFTGFDDIIEGLLFRFSVRLGAITTS